MAPSEESPHLELGAGVLLSTSNRSTSDWKFALSRLSPAYLTAGQGNPLGTGGHDPREDNGEEISGGLPDSTMESRRARNPRRTRRGAADTGKT